MLNTSTERSPDLDVKIACKYATKINKITLIVVLVSEKGELKKTDNIFGITVAT